MALRVVGAGLPRTGTLSLKTALEMLLGEPCYHMAELFEHPEHLSFWQDAGNADSAGWREFLAGYAAAVDFPASLFWRELMEAFPDAPVLLSRRDTPESWYRSMDKTILPNVRELQQRTTELPPQMAAFAEMMRGHMADFAAIADDPEAGAALYERHLAEVRTAVPADRLVVWQPGDGWAPLADMLGVPVPDEPFPHVNDSGSFQENFGQRSRDFLTENG